MENALNYFYNVRIQNIRRRDDTYFIDSGTSLYAFQKCDDFVSKIDAIYQLNAYILYNNIYIYRIVKNKYDGIITSIENSNYILLEIDDQYDKKITLDMIFSFQYKVQVIPELKVNQWKKLWIDKIDYFEYQMSKVGLKFPIIRESMSYYIGLAENAISALDEILNEDLYLQHRRINKNSTYYDFFNPLNLVFDTRIRDFCEYYKSSFIYDEYDKFLKISNIFEKINYSDNEIVLFYIRMFFPTFYFDIYEKIMASNENEKKLDMVIKKVDNYQCLLFELNDYLSKKILLPEFKWINRK